MATLEVPPSGEKIQTCSTEGCDQPVLARGLCATHYGPRKRKAGPKPSVVEKEPEKVEAQPSPTTASGKIITHKNVKDLVVVTMTMLAGMVDESFSVWELGKDGKPQVQARVDEAVTEMMPWMEIYGAQLLKMLPWCGLIGGVLTLAMPAADPCLQIIAGVRKPRFSRKDAGDIYTEAYMKAQTKKQAAQPESKPPPNVGNGKPAAQQTVEVDSDEADRGKTP